MSLNFESSELTPLHITLVLHSNSDYKGQDKETEDDPSTGDEKETSIIKSHAAVKMRL